MMMNQSDDPQHKKYVYAVEKALQTFEAVNEWADVIKFLNGLSKTLASFPQYPMVPLKVVVAKRLAQCLNPALPAGVHTKALEVYLQIFKQLGRANLSPDLMIWSYGLFPFLQFASMGAKPQLLGLYRDYYIPLGSALRSCTRGFILALLPGVEEEGNEFFEETAKLLDSLKQSVTSEYFYQCFWLATTYVPQCRLAAMNYIATRFPTVKTKTDFAMVFGDDQDIIITAFSELLADANLLVQRTALELIVSNLPIERSVFEERQLIQLAKSALCVVLRKEMSLNRRLYAWLTGQTSPDKSSSSWINYGLPIATKALEDMFRSDIGDSSDWVRPYKVLISLMDRSDIGMPLVDAAFETILDSAKKKQSQHSSSCEELMQITAMFFGMLDPLNLWSKIYLMIGRIVDESNSSYRHTMDLFVWFIAQIRSKDEDTVYLHTPLLILVLLNQLKSLSVLRADIRAQFLDALQILIDRLPNNVAVEPLNRHIDIDSISTKLYRNTILAEVYHSKAYQEAELAAGGNFMPLALIVLEQLSLDMGRVLCENENIDDGFARDYFAVGQLISKLVSMKGDAGLRISKPEWLSNICEVLKISSDTLFVSELGLLVELVKLGYVQADSLGEEVVSGAISRTWNAIDVVRSSCSYERLRLVYALWNVWPNQVIRHICACLSEPAIEDRKREYDRFNTFWRAFEHNSDSYVAFSKPIFIMLDLLRSHLPAERRTGEMFLKSSSKSLGRVVDPILVILMDPMIQVTKDIISIGEFDVSVSHFCRPFNFHQVDHALELLIEIFHFGQNSLCRAFSSMDIAESAIHPLFHFRPDPDGYVPSSYFDLLVFILLTFLMSEIRNGDQKDMDIVSQIHCKSSELLHFLVVQGQDFVLNELNSAIIDVTLDKLLFCIEYQRFEVQSKLLSLVHAIIRSGTAHQRQVAKLISTTSAALRSVPNRSILPYTVDFVISSMPWWKTDFQAVLYPLLLSFVQSFELYAEEWQSRQSSADELCVLLGGLESLINFCLSEAQWSLVNEQRRNSDNSTVARGISGLVTGVFVAEVSSPENVFTGNQKLREIVAIQLIHVVSICFKIWRVGTKSVDIPELLSSSTQVAFRARRFLDTMMKISPLELVDSLVVLRLDSEGDLVYKFLLELRSYEPPVVANAIFDLLKDKVFAGMGRESLRQALKMESTTISDTQYIEFLELLSRDYVPVDQLEDILVLVFNFAKELLAYPNSQKTCGPAMLRLFTNLLIKLPNTAVEARRNRREIVETYQKFLDSQMMLAARILEPFMKKPESELNRPDSIPGMNEKDISLAVAILEFIASTIIPSFREMPFDPDRLQAFASNVTYYILTPHIKSKMGPHVNPILRILAELTKINPTYRVWKKEAFETFMDPKFFSCSRGVSETWVPIIRTISWQEKEKMEELLTRLASVQTGLFVSKDSEISNRMQLLKRITYLVYCADYDHFLPQLPVIQERLVDIFKTPYNMAHAEAYLCLRILFLKVSLKNLTAFWPVIVTELVRLFVGITKKTSLDRDSLMVMVGASKFLDMLILMAPSEYQIHQWIVMTDTPLAKLPHRRQELNMSLIDTMASILQDAPADQNPTVVSDPILMKRLLIPDRLRVSTIQTIDDLAPFFQSVTTWRYQEQQRYAQVYYNSVPSVKNHVSSSLEAKSKESNLNSRIVDIKAVEQSILADFVEGDQ